MFNGESKKNLKFHKGLTIGVFTAGAKGWKNPIRCHGNVVKSTIFKSCSTTCVAKASDCIPTFTTKLRLIRGFVIFDTYHH